MVSILAKRNNEIVWMVSIRHPISNPSTPLFQAFGDRSMRVNYN